VQLQSVASNRISFFEIVQDDAIEAGLMEDPKRIDSVLLR
jgi:hypothetical protein